MIEEFLNSTTTSQLVSYFVIWHVSGFLGYFVAKCVEVKAFSVSEKKDVTVGDLVKCLILGVFGPFFPVLLAVVLSICIIYLEVIPKASKWFREKYAAVADAMNTFGNKKLF